MLWGRLYRQAFNRQRLLNKIGQYATTNNMSSRYRTSSQFRTSSVDGSIGQLVLALGLLPVVVIIVFLSVDILSSNRRSGNCYWGASDDSGASDWFYNLLLSVMQLVEFLYCSRW